jgi:amino-acid N-acetyltransferase
MLPLKWDVAERPVLWDRAQVEAHLSRALSVPVVRRHARGPADAPDGFHYGPAVRIVSGNFVTGKRRGVVDGVDFGATGSGVQQAY